MADLTGPGDSPEPLNHAPKPRIAYGYVILLAGFFILVVSGGAQFSFGVFFKPMVTEFGWTREVTSGAYSLSMILQGVSGIFTGRLSDRFGAKPVITISGILLGSGYMLLALTSQVWQVYLFYGVLVSLGGATWVPVLSSVIRWFNKRRGLTSGIVVSGIGLGTVIVPPFANYLIGRFTWRTSYFILGVIAMVIIAATAQLLKRNPGTTAQPANPGQALGVEIKGLTLKETLVTRQFWIIGILYLGFGYCLHTIMVHMVPHATDSGVSAGAAAAIMSVIGGVSIIGRVGLGGGGDRLGTRRILISIATFMSVSFIWILFAGELWGFYLFAALFALSYGGLAAVQSPLVAEFFGLRAHGATFGLVNFAAQVGGASGVVIAGRIFDTTGSYFPAFVICAALSFTTIVLAFLLKPSLKLYSKAFT